MKYWSTTLSSYKITCATKRWINGQRHETTWIIRPSFEMEYNENKSVGKCTSLWQEENFSVIERTKLYNSKVLTRWDLPVVLRKGWGKGMKAGRGPWGDKRVKANYKQKCFFLCWCSFPELIPCFLQICITNQQKKNHTFHWFWLFLHQRYW